MIDGSRPRGLRGGHATAIVLAVAGAQSLCLEPSAFPAKSLAFAPRGALVRTTTDLISTSDSDHCVPSLLGGVQLFCSEEVDSRATNPHDAAAKLDDSWRAALDSSTVVVGRIEAHPLPVVLGSSDGVVVTAELRDIQPDEALSIRCDALGRVATTQGFADSGNGTDLQESAPRPNCLTGNSESFWNEQSGGTSSRNAVLFRFSQPVRAFGAWFGDLETRNDGFGRAAVVRLLDEFGGCLGDSEVVSDTRDSASCGDHSDTSGSGCGNRATRWIGFVSPEPEPAVSAMLVVVGDDDRNEPNDGYREHISFIGPSIGRLPPSQNARAGSPSPSRTLDAPAARVYLPSVLRTSAPGPRMGAGACH